MFIKQTQKTPQETLECNLTKQREIFSFKPSIILGRGSKWMTRLTNSKVYKAILNITQKNSIFKLYTDLVDEFSSADMKDEIEEILDISNISTEHLQKNRTT